MDEEHPRAPLSAIGRLRVEAVRGLARLLGVPMRIFEHEMREVKQRSIAEYLRECHEIGEKVFNMSVEDLLSFHQWAYPHLYEMIDSPFCLHEHPLYFVARFEGIWDHTNPQMKTIEQKWCDSGIRLRWPNGDLD